MNVMNLNILDTGDILLFKSKNSNSIIGTITHSPYTHTGLVVKNPWWGNISPGIYVIQSVQQIYKYQDIEHDLHISGVQMERVEDVIKDRSIDVRYLSKVSVYSKRFKKKFKRIHDYTYGRSYDNDWCDWITVCLYNLGCTCFTVKKHDTNFWCSSLVAYYYTNLGLIDKDTDWSNMSPADISKMKVKDPYYLSPPICLQLRNKL